MSGAFKKCLAEAIGTAFLVLIGCGSAAIGGYGAAAPVGILPIALAFGLAVTAMAYGIGPISGCHINPAVTVSIVAAGRMPTSDAIAYIISQLIGGIIGALVLYVIVSGKLAASTNGLGANGWGPGYLGEYGIGSAILTEIIATFLFTMVILAITQFPGAVVPAGGLIIGLTLVIIHIVFIPVTGVSVNPARSLGPAIFSGANALAQVWLFIVMPPIGGAIAGWLFRAKILSAVEAD
jgi:aquaporin Z